MGGRISRSSAREYKTLVRLTPDLQLAVKADLLRLGSQLVAKELITPDQYEEILNPHNPLMKRAADLVQFVQNKVRQNARCYYTFVAELEKNRRLYSDIMEELRQTCPLSSHSTGMHTPP